MVPLVILVAICKAWKKEVFFGSETSVHSRDEDVNRCHRPGLGRSWLLVGQQLVTDFDQVGLGENETDILHNVGEDLLQSGV